ncbi:hypothetical protein GFS03_03580 [Sulfolobus sp. E5-1-F]|uniref:winged helix-turn-helix domain-containing protein n=1 Tax=Sulfolobaceae TaxID=118883 RepID=UPI001296C972|nr:MULTISPECIES: winged helix-turn-helix domain-containing protein [unclassified Sulfolobus]QGA53736.1 hypothetical protein GFS03_03580 [Sulfolobus sp. E5-1-F]QGA68609.1 hypothetical protein GFS33_07640 [Sulfolobus sp. E11-6]
MALKFNKRKRTQFEIIYDILNAVVHERVLKTRLIYKANISYNIAEKYLPLVEKLGLIRKDDKFYYITSKGLEFHKILEEYSKKADELKKLLEVLEKEIH